MSTQRHGHGATIYERLMYPGPEPRVPVNKLGLRDWETLEKKEAEIVAVRMHQGLPDKARELSYDGFKALHHHLFQDVYGWAGQERTYTTGRNREVPFAPPEHIAGWMEKQFEALRAANYHEGSDPVAFAEKAAELVNEINAAHSFIEGNGRVQRTWLRLVAERAGFELELRDQDRDAWNDAARVGFLHADSRPFARLIESRLERDQERAREDGGDHDRPSAAAALSAYVERKLRKQYPNDPETVKRGLSVAREKIADMVAEGKAIPVPRVIDTHELNRLTEGKYRSGQDKETDRGNDRER